jgi:DNA-binding transcriptional ArsR family regulator
LELLERELDVTALAATLSVSASTSARHVAMLRAHGLVEKRRRGRQVFYRATKPGLDAWIREGLRLVQREAGAPRAFEAAPAND